MNRMGTRVVVLLAALIIILFGSVSVAQADLSEPATPTLGMSISNPGPPPDVDSDAWWRLGWGNSLHPDIEFKPPEFYMASDDGLIIGMLYYVDRNFAPVTSGLINTANPANYYRATFGGASGGGPYGTNFANTFDILGIWHDLGGAAGPSPQGVWFVHYAFFTTKGLYSPTFTSSLAIDLVNPSPVTGLSVSTGLSQPPVVTWQPYTRAHLTWNPSAAYDTLAGVGYYQVLVDDSMAIPEKMISPAQGRVYELPWLPVVQDMTIENMPPGKHKLSIQCVDRATNVSTETSTFFYSDPDTPTVQLTSPLDGNIAPGTILSAEASDAAGPPTVVFSVDGSPVATLTSPPYECAPDFSAITPGIHTIGVSATDHLGRKVVDSTTADRGLDKPDLSVLHPTNGEAFGQRAALTAATWDKYGVTGVGFRIDGALVSTWTPASGTPTSAVAMILPNLSALSTGVHSLSVTSRNVLGHVTTATVSFSYDPTNLPSFADFLAVDAGTDPDTFIDWDGSSGTNPADGWRQGWGNSLNPSFNILAPLVDPALQPSMLYTLDHAPQTIVNTATPGIYRRTVLTGGTELNQTIDLLSIVNANPVPLDGRTFMPGHASAAEEGIWYLHMNVVGNDASGSGTRHVTFGIDDTQPSKVTNVKCYASATSPLPLAGLVTQGAVHVRWDAKEYDTLSGTAYFRVYVDGQCVVPGDVGLDSPESGGQGVVWYTGAGSGSLTIENLPSGTHTVQVTAVDRATNESVRSDPFTFTMDSDIPVVTITNPPPAGATFDLLSVPAATARDAAGITSVGFRVDGSALGTLPAGGVQSFDASLAVNWAPFANGSHILAVTAVDLAGHTITATRAFVLDKSRPKPTLTILNPAYDDATLTAASDLSALAEDGVGVSAIGFAVDGSAVGTIPAGGMQTFSADLPFAWSAGFGTGPHTLTVTALNTLGNTTVGTRPFKLDKSLPKPTVKITQPLSGQTWGTPAPFAANVGDPSGIVTVAFSVDGTPVGTYIPPSGTPTAVVAQSLSDISGFSAGMHILTVTAFDTLGHSSFDTVGFIFDPGAPPPVPGPTGSTETTWTGLTTTNPGKEDEEKSFWRESWGNSLFPQLTITSPSFTVFDKMRTLYVLDRYSNTAIDPAFPTQYSVAVRSDQTHFDGSIDLNGVLASDFDAFNGLTLYPLRAESPAEGVWYWHMAVVHEGSNVPSLTVLWPIGIDVTPPDKVQNLKALASPNATQPLSGWAAQSRVHLQWTAQEYDRMSGVAYFRVYLDGKCVVPGDVPVEDPASGEQGIPWYFNAQSGNLTLENLSPGTHTFQVSAVDHATNEGLRSDAVTVKVDGDLPGVTVLTPARDMGLIGATAPISALASDGVGIKAVGFRVGNSQLGTVTPSSLVKSFKASLNVNWDLHGIDNGVHMLTATAVDQGGHVVSSSRQFTLDKNVPSLSIVSAGPSPFFPRIREGYKDNFVVKFSTNKNVTAYLYVYTSAGKLYRTISKSVAPGTTSFAWNGRSSSGALSASTFKVKVKVVDAAGNSRTSGSYTAAIRFYELAKTGSGTVKVISR